MRFLRLGSAGMRGKVGSGINPLIVIDYASAFGIMIDGGAVVIGRDSRFSSPMLFHALSSALMSCGCHIIDAGIAPAPTVQFLVSHLKASGGILLGAGHHPAGWNAVVPLSETGAYLNSVQTQELLDIYHGHTFLKSSWDMIGKEEVVSNSAIDAYLDKICSVVDADAISKGDFKVVADFCNSSGARLRNGFAHRLGIDLISINDKYSGVLPHDPEPRPRSALQVHSLMRYIKADVGFLFNSDMSRTSVITSSGETLSEEYTFPLVADYITSMHKNSIVVTNDCTTRTVDLVVEKNGGIVDKTSVGQSPIIDRMIEMNATIGGDGSGSFAHIDGVPGFDSFITVALILESMVKRNATSHDLAQALPTFHIIKKKVSCSSSHAYTLLRNIRDHFPDAKYSELDGMRFDWDDGWIHLRAATTEPTIRMIVEWRTKAEAEERCDQMRGVLERLVAS